ncbi:AmmeMemoRadiSam system protein A [bacterium]|nr:AmmeMemoRadiSam system protein A [bacterium]
MAQPRPPLPQAARQRLLAIARQSVEAAVTRQPPPAIHALEPELQTHCGAFVTLKLRGRLRGCIGQFTSDRPLGHTVADMARAAATEDFRFLDDPIRPAELTQLAIDISVLSPMQPIDDPLDIQLGVHGIYIKGPSGRAGTYLPQVAIEHHMTKEGFLSSCCANKAGLSPDAWRTGEATVHVYTAEVFGDD